MAEHPQAPGGRRDCKSTFDIQPASPSTSSSAFPSATASEGASQGRNRRRSNTIVGENPFETPISSEDAEIARLIRTIKHQYDTSEKNNTVRKAPASHQLGTPADDLADLFAPDNSTPFPAFDSSILANRSIVEAPATGADTQNLFTTTRHLVASPQTLDQTLRLPDLEYEADTESNRSHIGRPLPDPPQATRSAPGPQSFE